MAYDIAYNVGRKIWLIHWKKTQYNDQYDITQHKITSILINEHNLIYYKIRYHSIDVWVTQANMHCTQKDAKSYLQGYLRGLEDEDIEITTRRGENAKTKRSKRQNKVPQKRNKKEHKKSCDTTD